VSPHNPDHREADTWFSDEQLEGLERAEPSDPLGAAVPTRNVSNGEYVPVAQTSAQREVEARVAAIAEEASGRLRVSRRRFLSGAGGMAASFIAMNEVFGHFFDASPFELFEPAAAAEKGLPADAFVFDDQLHMVRDSQGAIGMPLRAASQGAGTASTAAGFKANPFNPGGYPDELGNPWSAWTDSLRQTPNVGTNFMLTSLVKDVYLDSNVTVGILSNAPLGLFLPPGASEPIPPRTIGESLSAELLTGYQTVAVRDFVNRIAGSTRLLAHGQFYPGKNNLEFMQRQIEELHPDSWKGYTIAFSAKNNDDPTRGMERWSLDDEAIAYPTYELIRRNRAALKDRPGFFNICIHKGLTTLGDPADPASDQASMGNPNDIPKAARDWPEFNFIIYHASWAPLFYAQQSLRSLREGRLLNGVPDVQWVTRMAQQCAHLPNVYAELGTTFAATVTTFPTVCAHILGQLLKYWGPDRIVFGSDSLWYGAPQWQIEALWRFQIPEALAAKYGYPRLDDRTRRKILGLNSARLYKLDSGPQVSPAGLYRPVPRDFATRVPDELRATLADAPGSRQGPEALEPRPVPDRLARLRSDYQAAGGERDNLRHGWVVRS
jgi:predicted TIM-barrel fold metal-dependent hydrolase